MSIAIRAAAILSLRRLVPRALATDELVDACCDDLAEYVIAQHNLDLRTRLERALNAPTSLSNHEALTYRAMLRLLTEEETPWTR